MRTTESGMTIHETPEPMAKRGKCSGTASCKGKSSCKGKGGGKKFKPKPKPQKKKKRGK